MIIYELRQIHQIVEFSIKKKDFTTKIKQKETVFQFFIVHLFASCPWQESWWNRELLDFPKPKSAQKIQKLMLPKKFPCLQKA